jgi:DNA-binding NarL/FixJ family response regulator
LASYEQQYDYISAKKRGSGMNVFIIDDHQLFSSGMKHMLATAFDSADIECFSNPLDALECGKDIDVHLILLDFYIPGYGVAEFIPKLLTRYSGAKIVIVSSSVSSTDRAECLQYGACAYFEKHLPPENVLSQLKKVLSESGFDDVNSSYVHTKNRDFGLGLKKTEVLILLARGFSNKEIAQRLDVSPETIKTHLSDIYRIIQVTSREGARSWAYEHGLV